MPEPATAAAALQSGEVDWLEYAHFDLVPVLQKNRNIVTDLRDSLGDVGMLSLNQVPPFRDVRARRAILTAMSQDDFMHALTADDKMWKPMRGFFTPGTPLYTEEGSEILKAPRKLDTARRLLAESGYAGEPVTCMAAQNLPLHKAFGDVTVDLLQRLGMKVDFAAIDWGTVVARRGQKAPPSQGGWHMHLLSLSGADTIDPTTRMIRANGDVASNGWSTGAEVEAEIASWYDAKTLEEEKAAARRLNRAAFDHVVYAPLGTLLRHKAYRKNVSGIVQGPLPFFWSVSKTA
jgi:peptide/nickel transport system substrate-binding protein